MSNPNYSFQENGFVLRGRSEREHAFSFRNGLKVRYRPYRKDIKIRDRNESFSLASFSAADQKAFLGELFSRWNSADPEAARKGAFDYAEDRKSFSRLVLAVCLLFTGPMAVALLNDSLKQASCTTQLQGEVQPATIEVIKVKKEKKGQYILKLAFSEPGGKIIKGEERWITDNENDIPKSLPIIYSPSHPECWAMTTTGTEISWAKRRYFSAVSGLFGLFFLGLTLWGVFWGAGRLLSPPPFREETLALLRK